MGQREQIRETLSRDKYISDGLTKEFPQDRLVVIEAQIHEMLTQARFDIAGNAEAERVVTLIETFSDLLLDEFTLLRSELLGLKANQ